MVVVKNPDYGVDIGLKATVDPIPIFSVGRYEILTYATQKKRFWGKGCAVINKGFCEYEFLGMFTIEGGGYHAAVFCLQALHESDVVWDWACREFSHGGVPREWGSKRDSFKYMVFRPRALRPVESVDWSFRPKEGGDKLEPLEGFAGWGAVTHRGEISAGGSH